MTKKCIIYPQKNKFIPDLIKGNKVEDTIALNINNKEILRSMQYGNVFEILENGDRVYLDTKNFNKNNNVDIIEEDKNLNGIGRTRIGLGPVL